MSRRLTENEANEILQKLIDLRKKCKKNKKFQAEYKYQEEVCAKAFDYLVTSKTNKYRKFSNYKDLQQDGRVALILALRSFDLEKGSFFWWANQYIKTKISREANRHSTINIPIKQTKNIQPYKVSEMPTVIDGGLDALEIIQKNEIKDKFNNAVNLLPEEQKKILKLNGIKSYSISRISKELKIPRPYCIKLLNEAKQNLKENLKNN